MTINSIYFSGLNGLRAIAAIAVLISHITLALNDYNLDPFIFGAYQDGKPRGTDLAGNGVTIFFVLSGFLITYLLLIEKKTLETINIKNFYARRILRIWPLYYLYLSIVVLTIICFSIDANITVLPYYIFFSANIPFALNLSLPYLAHYWSLGVEEQFYLFWPWINKILNKIILPSIVFVLFFLLLKITLHLFLPYSKLESLMNVFRFHCLIIGGIGAILYDKKHLLFLKFTDNIITQGICWVIIFLVAINKFHIASFLDSELISFVSLALIIGQIQKKNRILNLESKIFNFLGKISYGIYVIHPLVIFFFSKFLNLFEINNFIKYIIVYFSIISITIILSYLSFNYFELYFLKLKSKYVVVKSTSVS